MKKLVDSIELPRDLRKLPQAQLQQICNELRDELIDTVAESGGHFASSLGVAEITVALHYLFDTPFDRIVWDTGHQGYIHKMVTGRRNKMATIRTKGGLSGFLRRDESNYDTFVGGHAGTSISAAVGMATVLRKTDPKRHVVAVIGDGSIASGMAFEALNHAGDLKLGNLIVLLNDNEMSISPNVGAISWLFSKAVTSHASTKARSGIKALYKKGYLPELVYKAIDRAEGATQGFFSSPAFLFEAFGFRYIGRIDGHNVSDIITALNHAKEQDVPVLIHAHTIKGKGYLPAEQDPTKWHATVPFNRDDGIVRITRQTKSAPVPNYTDIFGEAVLELAKADERVVAITAAMAEGTGLDKLREEMPQSFFDVGICEQHAVTFAAGLACEGYKPICAIYSSFMQRAFDQILNDVCVQNLPVVLAMDRAGVVGNDGETHQGVFDIGFLRLIPNITLMAPADENELRNMLFSAVRLNRPVAIRYPRGHGIGVKCQKKFEEIELGKGLVMRRGSDALLICYGPIAHTALSIAETLNQKHDISVTVINARFAKPMDTELLMEELPHYPVICTLEDHSKTCGFGSAVLEFVNEKQLTLQTEIECFGVGDEFIPHATQEEQKAMHGFDFQSIINHLIKRCSKSKIAAVG